MIEDGVASGQGKLYDSTTIDRPSDDRSLDL